MTATHRALLLVFLLLASGATVSAQTSDAAAEEFQRDFERLEGLVERKRWKAADQGLEKLLADHEGAWYARARRAEIEGMCRRVSYRLAHEEPAPETVLSGKLERFDSRSGRFKVSYENGSLRDFEAEGSYKFHPARFTGPHTITIKGDDYPAPLTVLACTEGDRLLSINLGMTDDEGGGFLASIRAVDGQASETLDSKDLSPCREGRKFTIKIAVTDHSVSVSYNGRKFLSGKHDKDAWGYLGLSNLAGESIVIEGEADPAWIQQRVDLAEEKTRAAFDKEFKVGQKLPKWLYEAGAARPAGVAGGAKATPPADRVAPGETTARQREQLDRVFFLGRSRGPAFALELLDQLEKDTLPPLTMEWARARLLSDHERPAAALAAVDTVVAGDPAFHPAHVLRAGLLVDLHRYDDAADAWTALIARHPDHGPFYRGAAEDLLSAGDPARAKKFLDGGLARGLPMTGTEELNGLLIRALRGPEWSTSHEVTTRHYLVRSNIDRSVCQEAAEVLEQAYLAYKAWLPRVPEETTRKFPVYLFAGEASYQRYARDCLGTPVPGSAGLYVPILKQLLIWNLPDREQMMRTVRHEAFHQYLDRVMPNPPRWFNEGHAEYFETARQSDGSWRTGVVRKDHLASLDRIGIEALKTFFARDARTFMQTAEHSYAQSWSVIYFLHEGGPSWSPVLRRLFEALADGKDEDAAWKQALGRTTFEEFETAYLAFTAGLER
ncbi:MAG: DUF1570 domain-containing protein [Planctomycetota bacterium]